MMRIRFGVGGWELCRGLDVTLDDWCLLCKVGLWGECDALLS